MVEVLIDKPLHKAMALGLSTLVHDLWLSMGELMVWVVLQVVKQECHEYSLGNGCVDIIATSILKRLQL